LKLFDSEDSLEKELNTFITENKAHLGMVALDVPLISNLDAWSNIALIKQYHQNLSRHEAESKVAQYLQRFHLESIASKRNPALKEDERFCVLLLRAAMVEKATIVIDRPFKIMPDLKHSQFIEDALKKIEDLFNTCYIFDYLWNKDRYRISDAQKN
jgi:ABC-type lipoprotein export system ATPase subunit